MTKLKFDESKVINALHTDLASNGQTGIFANDIFVLKRSVENRDEKAFGTLTITKGQTPFHNDSKAAALFYPASITEVFGEGYIDYLENYKLPEYKKELSYKEYCELIKNRNKDCKKYIFSASSKRTDWMDGEVYNANVDYGDSYGEEHGKTGKVVLIVEAPNELLAKVTAAIWFHDIGGYHKSGCNYMGRGWVDSKDWYNRRFFGEMQDSDIKKAISLIKLYDTKSNYNLDGKVETIKFEDVIKNRFFSNSFKVNKKSYAFEGDDIISYNLDGSESLKERVARAFKNAGLKTYPIYDDEAKMLYDDFDNTMNAIIESVKAFNAIDKNIISKLNSTVRKLGEKDYKFVRPEVKMNNGKDENKDLIFARCVQKNVFRTDTDYYSDEDTAYVTRHPWYITKGNFRTADLLKTSLNEDFFRYFDSKDLGNKLKILNKPVFNVEDFIIMPYSYDIEYYERQDDKRLKYRAKDFFIWDEIVDGITLVDLNDLEISFVNIPGVSDESILFKDLVITNDTFDGHKCIKVHVHIKNFNIKWSTSWNDNYSPKKSFKHNYYIAFLEAMYKKGYHVVTAANQKDDDGKYGYEEMDMYFAKNRKGIDYSNTFTPQYWTENIRPNNIKSMW